MVTAILIHFFFSSCADIISHVAVEITRKNQLINLFDSILSIYAQKQWRTNIKPIAFIRQKKEKNKSVIWFVLSVICAIIQNGNGAQWKSHHHSYWGQAFKTSPPQTNALFNHVSRDVNDVCLPARKINSGDWQAHYLCPSAGCCLTSMKTTDGNASLISQLVAVLSFVIRLSRSCKKKIQKKKVPQTVPVTC